MHENYTACKGLRSIIGPCRKKTYLRGFANNKGADQPAHTHRLISAFVIHVLESIISGLAISNDDDDDDDYDYDDDDDDDDDSLNAV